MTETDSTKSLKILVSGDVEGKLNDLYSKVRTIQSKAGKFDLLLCVGEFFADTEKDNAQIDECLADPTNIPITTYILGTNKSNRSHYFRDPSGYELSKDKITYLGPRGMYTTRQGLKIVYLSGIEEEQNDADNKTKRIKKSPEETIKEEGLQNAATQSNDTNEPITFNRKDVDNIINSWEQRNTSDDDCVDILLTNQWPKYVEMQSAQKLENGLKTDKFGSELISYLTMRLRPRYHFSALENVYFERTPYRNHLVLVEKEKNLTRFFGLAKVNKTNKPKCLYAFNIMPAKKMTSKELAQQTSGTQVTDCPYLNNLSSKLDESIKSFKSSSSRSNNKDDEQPTLQYFYDAGHIKKMNEINEKALNEKKRRLEAIQSKEQEPCWFCLGGSKVERHYIVSVGDKSYLAYAKGAINKDHLLIIPIDHVQSTVHADEKLLEDINKYKMALKKYFMSKRKIVLFYERNFRTKHMQIQVFAIKSDKAYLLKNAFLSMAKDEEIRLNEIPQFTNLKQVIRQNQPFFYLELPNEDNEQDDLNDTEKYDRYLCEIRSNNFPINFGRDVVASELILNVPERVDWKTCVMPQEEEKKMSIEFRNEFKKFDPFV